jgi:hypothetical protein
VARLDDQEAVSHVDHVADDAIVAGHNLVPTHPCLLPVAVSVLPLPGARLTGNIPAPVGVGSVQKRVARVGG